MNPTAPNLQATIKLHKQNTPIRLVVNWKNSHAYNVKVKVKLSRYTPWRHMGGEKK
jgi:hypothetical protein